MLSGSTGMIALYDLRLVALSMLVATMASYVALELATRVRQAADSRAFEDAWAEGTQLNHREAVMLVRGGAPRTP